MSDIRLEQDMLSRNKIVSETNKNFFVEAGAGSGKTTMLVRRMVAMIEAGIPIEQICAITFTKAAAGEFYARFQKLLIERSNQNSDIKKTGQAGELPVPTEESEKKCREALEKIDLCFMGTIDSFCSMVLSEHPSEAKIPSDSKIISDEEVKNIYRQQFVKICAGNYGEELQKKAQDFSSFYKNAEEVFAAGEAILMNNRNVEFQGIEAVGKANADVIFKQDKENLLSMVAFLKDHQELKYTKEKNNLAAWNEIEDIYRNLDTKWSSNFESVLYAIGKLSKIRLIKETDDNYPYELGGFFRKGGSSGSWLECCVKAESDDKSEYIYEKLQKYRYHISMSFLTESVQILEENMRSKGYLTFFDYLYYLREMLKTDAMTGGKLIRNIRESHRYFLIDEFQDTNPLQAEIFFYLSSDSPDSQWNKCQPEPGSLFIVGDPKQSIYRFRSADVASYLKVKKLFSKPFGENLALTQNFRSTNMLCKYFNACFTELMHNETENQSKFEEIPPKGETSSEIFQGIFINTDENQKDDTDTPQIAGIIKTLVNNENYQLKDNDGIKRKLRYSDIMVITYGKKALKPIMTELYNRGIPSRVEGEVSFGQNEALCEVFKIYSAVSDLEDAVALYGALTGKLIGFNQDDLLYFKGHQGKISLKASFKKDAFKDEICLQIIDEIEKLNVLYHNSLNLTPAGLFSKIIDDFRVYEYTEAENLEVLYYALELLRNAEISGTVVTFKDASDYLYELLSGKSGEERCLSLIENKDAVHLANLHKVKGLEAPVVILAAANKPSDSLRNQIRVEHKDEASCGYLFGLKKERKDTDEESSRFSKGNYFENPVFYDEKEEEKTAQSAEIERLLYVAATRAKNALIICERDVKRKTPIWEPLLIDGLTETFSIEENESLSESSDITTDRVKAEKLYNDAGCCVLNNRDPLNSTYEIKTPSHLSVPSKLAEDSAETVISNERTVNEDSSNKASYSKTVHKFPDLLGTMTHRLMEMIVSTKCSVDTDKAVEEIIREYRTEETKDYEAELKTALTDVAKTMNTGGYTQTNGVPQDLLKVLKEADEVYCEVPFCYMDSTGSNNELWNGVIDLIYCTEGKWHIVDYKTNADGSALDKKYFTQLEAYKLAFKANTGEEADALTYHIDV